MNFSYQLPGVLLEKRPEKKLFVDRCDDGMQPACPSDCRCCADSNGHYFTSVIIFIIAYGILLLLSCIALL